MKQQSTLVVPLALALTLAFAGAAAAQADVSVAPPAGASSLAIANLPAQWDVTVAGAPPGSYAFLFAGFAPGTWNIYYSLPAGVVTLDVLDPLAFQIGTTDENGLLKAPFAKPPALEPWMENLPFYTQVLSVQLSSTRGTSPDQISLAFSTTNVVPLVLEKAQPGL